MYNLIVGEEKQMDRFDIAIIGTGPAGLSAALTAKARNKKFILLGSATLSTKVEKAHSVRNYLGLPNISGDEMQKTFLNQLKMMDIEITEDHINAVYAMGDYFVLQGNTATYEATTIILATGMAAVKTFPGETENLGKGVSYCATCDAALYKGKTAIIIAYSEKEEKEALFLSELASTVIYIPLYDGCTLQHEKIEVVQRRKPESIEVKDKHTILHTDKGDIEADGLFILRESVAASQLVPGLVVEDNHVQVDRTLSTNISGLFACGDITGAPYQYIKAAGEGNVAALSAVNYLSDR